MATIPAPAHVVRWSLTDRFGGVSDAPYDELNLGDAVGDDVAAVAENRRRLATRLGLERQDLVFMRQVHGNAVAVVAASGARAGSRPTAAEPPPEADALVTTARQAALVVLVADCVPVLLACDDPAVVAVAHAGRRGLLADVVPATVATMQSFGADPRDVRARVGPAICGGCYEVPAALQAEVVAQVPAARATTRERTPGLDVRAGVVAQLRAAGLNGVDVDARCTYESPDLYSFRRDGRTGRFAGVVWLAR